MHSACNRMSPKQRKLRSVGDYETSDSLENALGGMKFQPETGLPPGDTLPVAGSDWVLPSFDPTSTEAQSMQEELHRLQVLKSYQLLDANPEESFERITGLAGRFFDVPIAVVSLVDIGRQWFMSNRGLGDVRETPRKDAFCAHTILNKRNMMVVPDATKDFRFCENPLVTGAPHIRFYAGAPLMTPEGAKIGTLCLISDRPRPDGLSESEQESLHDLASMTVQAMVDRRSRLQHRVNSAELMAWTAHDLVTPVTGINLSLSLLQDDEDLQSRFDPAQKELLKTAFHCANMMDRMCRNVVDAMRQRESCLSAKTSSVQLMPCNSTIGTPCTNMADLLENLSLIIKPIPKQVPVILTLDASVPATIVCDDLVLFRSALNLLSHAASRTVTGYIRLKIYPLQDQLCFECEDTGPDIADGESLFQPGSAEDGNANLELSSIATQLEALDGEYGYWPRTRPGGETNHQEHRQDSGSVFWFRVPLVASESPTESTVDSSIPTPITGTAYGTDTPTRISCSPRHKRRAISKTSKLSLVVGDISQVEALQDTTPSIDKSVNSVEKKAQYKILPLPPSPMETTSEPRKRRGLVIEDSCVVRKSLVRALDRLGFEVSHAVNGMEGLDLLKETMFDLVLCDFLMPVMDGMDCIKQYREWELEVHPSFRQWIVGISAHANASDQDQGLEAGMDDFHPKPISIKTLTEIQQSDGIRTRSQMLNELEGSNDDNIQVSPVTSTSLVAAGTQIARQGPSRSPSRDGSIQAASFHKRRLSESSTITGTFTENQVCLVGIKFLGSGMHLNKLLAQMASDGWQTVVVHDGESILEDLQMRNWDAVLIDDDIPLLLGTVCITKFREWEKKNRVNRQRNTFLICDGDVPSPFDKTSVVHPPSGFDGVLGKPVEWNDMRLMINEARGSREFDIVVRGMPS